jgi:hypothetical protein
MAGVLIVAVLVGLRALLFAVGIEGMQPSVLASSIIAGGSSSWVW